MSKNKKTIIIVIVIAVFVVFGRIELSQIIDVFKADSTETIISESTGNQIESYQSESNAKQNYHGPTLATMDYSSMDLFKDGFAVVTLDFCADGDTVNFNVNGKIEKTRFLAVNTPEKDPDLRNVEPWGQYASNFTKLMLENADEIILELDDDSDTFDKYGRLLSWVWIDGQLFNYILVDQSLAEVKYLYGDYKYSDDLLELQEQRKVQGGKIWGEKDPDFNY